MSSLSNYCSYEGVLYCKPHFDQLFKQTGSLDKRFEGAPRDVRVDISADQGNSNSKVSSLFAGTQDKCVACKKTVFPLDKMCILIFVGTNGETYFNTSALVSCVQNFPKSRGPVVGILKGFAGLGGAILTQMYAVIHSPDHASLIFMVAVGPSMLIIALSYVLHQACWRSHTNPVI